ncbi:MAG: DUF58 domain-containing protein [Ilumatobacteraceae bacterium]
MTSRLTRQGWMVLASAVIAVGIGRLFGVLELFVIGAALAVAALLSVVTVWLRRPRVDVHRWIRPAVLTAGDVGRVEVLVQRVGAGTSPGFELVEPVGTNRTARMAVAPLGADSEVSAGYRIPTERRGVLPVGPLFAVRHDVLGLARSVTTVAGVDEVLVSPRAYLLDMPTLGQGVLGRHLMALAQRLGPGDFHSLRDYADGDEPRTIHWRASARSENLKVRQHAVEGLRRCLVVLDQHVDAGAAADEAFERAVTVAASVVHSADKAGLTTRFVTTDGADIRGPDVAAQSLHLLARIAPNGGPAVVVERDPGEGLGLVVAIGASPSSAPLAVLERVGDPTLTAIGVFTLDVPGRRSVLNVDARTEESFLRNWTRLAGVGGGDARARQRRDHALSQAGAPP